MTGILRLLHLPAPPRRLADECAAVLGMDHLVVSLTVGDRADRALEQLWSSGATGASFDDLQFTLGEGPGPDALRTGLLSLADDLSAVRTGRWPALVPALAELPDLPVRAVFCLPLVLGGITVGVLTALRATAGPMTGQEMDDAVALATALTLRHLGGGGAEPDPWVADLADGDLHRAVVHQATGMLSVQLGLPLGQALLRLRAYAYGRNRPIVAAAEDIVARRLRLDDDQPHGQRDTKRNTKRDDKPDDQPDDSAKGGHAPDDRGPTTNGPHRT
ncbi:ANTAR domain-containing protein [Streptomyces sp. NPDC057137]|uniref:ANTAR domain-containing protein n=1 Tax=Streptomyces sp. NPDC057137 TaxID=3346030 RepID=UPI003628451A